MLINRHAISVGCHILQFCIVTERLRVDQHPSNTALGRKTFKYIEQKCTAKYICSMQLMQLIDLKMLTLLNSVGVAMDAPPLPPVPHQLSDLEWQSDS